MDRQEVGSEQHQSIKPSPSLRALSLMERQTKEQVGVKVQPWLQGSEARLEEGPKAKMALPVPLYSHSSGHSSCPHWLGKVRSLGGSRSRGQNMSPRRANKSVRKEGRRGRREKGREGKRKQGRGEGGRKESKAQQDPSLLLANPQRGALRKAQPPALPISQGDRAGEDFTG